MKKKDGLKIVKYCKKMKQLPKISTTFFGYYNQSKTTPYEDPTTNAEYIADLVLKVIEKYKNHPNIKTINDKYKTNSAFTFYQVSLEEI